MKEIMRRSRIAAIAALGCSLALLTTALASAHTGNGGSGNRDAGQQSRLSWAMSRSPLTDLLPTEVGPFDQARGMALMIGVRSSTFVLHVSGIDPTVAGEEFGAHLHIGPCLAGKPADAGPHYNIDVVNGVLSPVVSDKTEIWLDFVVDASGRGEATARVPWVPAPGDQAIVIHKEPTDDKGVAGPRQACIPLVVH
jgi:hypothetical protein